MAIDDADTSRLPTLRDVARAAGVSLATVDRVVNARPGVRSRTVARVKAAMERVGYEPDQPIAAAPEPQKTSEKLNIAPTSLGLRVALVVADGWEEGADLVRAAAHAGNSPPQDSHLEIIRFDPRRPDLLAGRVAGLAERADAVLLGGASEDPRVLAALAGAPIPIVTIGPDLPRSARIEYAGPDFATEGRTAGLLAARLSRNAGPVGVLDIGPATRRRAERVYGARSYLEGAGRQIVTQTAGAEDVHLATALLLSKHPDLAALYLPEGHLAQVAADVARLAGPGRCAIVGHAFDAATRLALAEGDVDAIVRTDPVQVIRHALALLAVHRAGALTASRPPPRIEIVTAENMF